VENENRDYFFNILIQNDSIKEMCAKNNFMIDKEVPVPYRHLYFPYRKELEIFCFKQDICIYSKLFGKSISHKEAKITVGEEGILTVVLNKNAKNNVCDIGIPLVIIETKMSKNIHTHNLIAYSEKTGMVKTIFPYCKIYLLCFGDYRKNAHRHCSEFDEILNPEIINDKNYERGIIINKKTIFFTKTPFS